MGIPLYVVDGDTIIGKISETTKIRVMVLPIIAMLAVTMIVAGYRDEGKQIEIEVEEYPDELNIEPVNESDDGTGIDGRNLRPKNVTGVTTVNNESQLSLRVEPLSRFIEGRPSPSTQFLQSDFQVSGAFEGDLDLETLRIEVTETQSKESSWVQFLIQELEIDEGERWPEKEFSAGETFPTPDDKAYVGFDIDSNEFVANGRIQWESRNIEGNFTLQLQAIVEGNFSEEVVSTVELHIEGSD